MPVILDWQVPRMSWAMGSGKANGPGSVWPTCLRYWGIWRLEIGEGRCPWEGEGTSDLLLRGCPGRYIGAHVISLLFPPSQGCPGWGLMGGGIEWIAHFLNIFQNPDRWVEIMYSSADKRYDHATFVLELAPEASGSTSHDSKVSVLQLSLPFHHQPVAQPHYSSVSLVSLFWKAAPPLHPTPPLHMLLLPESLPW